MIKHLPKEVKKSAEHITQMSKNINQAHKPCKKCQAFLNYSRKQIEKEAKKKILIDIFEPLCDLLGIQTVKNSK